jgi:DNA-directed RNA polymerase specialized sigma24 family protein
MHPSREQWQFWLERGAGDIVFRAVCNTLRRSGYSLPQVATVAEDATQEAIKRFLEAGPTEVVTLSAFVAYLVKTAVNKVWADHRRPSLAPRDIPAYIAHFEPNHPPQEVVDIAVASLREDLSDEDREILSLKYISGKTDREIAARLLPPDGRTDSARGQEIRRRRLQALARIRHHMRERGIDPLERGFDGFLLDSGPE